MSLSRPSWLRSVLGDFQSIRVACGVAVLAVAVPRATRAQILTGWEAFVGYTYQRAEVTPRANGGLTPPVGTPVSQPPSAVNGWVASVQRSLPLPTVSWVGEARGAYAAGRFGDDCVFFAGEPQLSCGSSPLQHVSQYLLLTGLRFAREAGGFRLLVDGLAGMAKVNSSVNSTTSGVDLVFSKPVPLRVKSPAVEAGAGVDMPIRQHVDVRVRGSWLSTDLYKSFNEGWNHSAGLSTGIVLK